MSGTRLEVMELVRKASEVDGMGNRREQRPLWMASIRVRR